MIVYLDTLIRRKSTLNCIMDVEIKVYIYFYELQCTAVHVTRQSLYRNHFSLLSKIKQEKRTAEK